MDVLNTVSSRENFQADDHKFLFFLKRNLEKKEILTSALWGDYMYKIIHSDIICTFLLYICPNESKEINVETKHTRIRIMQSFI